jgi:hypothetical protein
VKRLNAAPPPLASLFRLFVLHPSSFILSTLNPILCCILLALAACSNPPEPPAVQGAPPAATAPQPPHEGWALVRLKIVDIEGNPLPSAVPVAVAQPNAFEEPVALGEPANDKGEATLYIPPDKRLYIRAWDFSNQLFANNYYDVFPGPVTEPGEMKLVMVPGGTIRAELVTADGTPVANEKVALMLYHPTQGAWWPTEATTDQKGVAIFGPVPAGIFTLRLKTESGASAETPQVTIQPGGLQDLGRLTM